MLRPAMKAHSSGFSLLELMITIAILAILIGVGVPNFRDFVRNSRISAASNDIVTDFNLARSEAVKRHVPVTLCKSSNGTACDTSDADPFNRWIVFVDDVDPALASADDGNGEVNGAEQILRTRQLDADLDVTVNANARRLEYMPSGFPDTGAGNRITQFTLCDDRGNVVTSGGDSAAGLWRSRQLAGQTSLETRPRSLPAGAVHENQSCHVPPASQPRLHADRGDGGPSRAFHRLARHRGALRRDAQGRAHLRVPHAGRQPRDRPRGSNAGQSVAGQCLQLRRRLCSKRRQRRGRRLPISTPCVPRSQPSSQGARATSRIRPARP